MNLVELKEIVEKIKVFSSTDEYTLTAFKNQEDGAEYSAWLVDGKNKRYVLKEAKNSEIEIYSSFFHNDITGAPRFIGSVSYKEHDYLMIEYVEGNDLCRCDRDSLKRALDALIYLQDKFWMDTLNQNVGLTFEKSLEMRLDRGKYLNDTAIEAAYTDFSSLYSSLPRTLCHDDLLPFNLIINNKGATIIDWELAGILPYPTSIARLLAHAEERNNALFYMTEDDKRFAIEYYYSEFISRKGITYKDYINSIMLFLLYEYCEWIMLGNKYKDADMIRYQTYMKKVKELLEIIQSQNF